MLRDIRHVFTRSIGQVLRNPVWVIVTLVQPLFYLMFYAPLLKRVTEVGGSTGSAYDVFVPGLLMQLALFGTAFSGFGLISELREGVIERFLVTPLSRAALLLGRCLANLVVLAFQAVFIVLVSWPLGLHLRWSAALGIVLLLVVGLTFAALSYTIGLILKSEDALAPLLNFLAVPMLLLSGMLLPLALAPTWLRRVADINPMRHAVDANRDLFAGELTTSAVARGTIVTLACAVAAMIIGTRRFSRAAE